MSIRKIVMLFILALLCIVGLYVAVKILAALSFAFFLGVAVGAVGAFAYAYKLNNRKRSC